MHRWTKAPVNPCIHIRYFRNKACNRLPSLNDLHNLSRGNPTKDACVVVPEISDSGSFHGATNMEHKGAVVNGYAMALGEV